MGNELSSLTKEEEKYWKKGHKLYYRDSLREEQLELIPKFADTLRICFVKVELSKCEFEHWYVTDGQWILEFGDGGKINHFTLVYSTKNTKRDEHVVDTFHRTDEVTKRMENLCGMTNYSLALRNSEHVARYIQDGRWISMQMVGSGQLKKLLFDWMPPNVRQKINTLPKGLEIKILKSVLYAELQAADQSLKFKSDYKKGWMEKENKAYNILFLGPTGSGKSTLINNLLNLTVCDTSPGAKSCTQEIRFYQCHGTVTPILRSNVMSTQKKKINIIDTIGFCDSTLTPAQIFDAIKDAVSVNVSYLDKVVIVCAGRIELNHRESIMQILDWLSFHENRKKFMFVLNKAETLTSGEQLANLAILCDTFGAETQQNILTNGQSIPLNMAVGFPPSSKYEAVKQDHEKMTQAVLTNFDSNKRIKVDKSICTIL